MSVSLSSLPNIVTRKRKRVGRGLGSGKGAKSGRGTTRHQRARESIPLHFEGGQAKMIKKYPLLRGKGKNKPIRKPVATIKIEALNVFSDEELVDMKTLRKKGIVSDSKKTMVKIIAGGELKRKLTVQLPVSESVREDIQKAGGKVKPV